MGEVSFSVAGVPAPQGSKVRTQWGVREDNDATRPWRSAVAFEATAAMQNRDQLEGPLQLRVSFYFPRPKAHYRSGKLAGQLRPDAPEYHASKPDCDKLLRAIGDSLSGIVARDDSQFSVVVGRKFYGHPRAIIVVSELDQ